LKSVSEELLTSDKKIGRKKRLPHWVLWPKSYNVREHLTILSFDEYTFK